MPGLECCKCDGEAGGRIIYCVECQDVFCKECADRIHQYSDKEHSLERIADESHQGVHLLSPLVDEIEIAIIILLIAWKVDLPEDYLALSSFCPFLTFARRLGGRFDTGVVHLFHDTLNDMCGSEDSLWKFYGDMWVRSIVTGTDSMVVLLSSSLSVILADVAAIYIMVPIMSVLHAVIFSMIYWLENLLLKVEGSALANMESIAKALNVIDCGNEPPPATHRRDQPGEGYYDWITYELERCIRIPAYFYGRVSERLEDAIKRSSIVVFVIRLYLIGFGAFANQFNNKTGMLVYGKLLLLGIVGGKLVLPIERPKQAVMATVVAIPSMAFASSLYKLHRIRFAPWIARGEELSDDASWYLVKTLTGFGQAELTLCLEGLLVVLVWIFASKLLW